MNAIKITSLLVIMDILAFAGIINMSLTSCAGTSPSSVLTAAENEAWTAANALETANTASGGVFTKAVVDAVLVATHNTGDEGVVQAAAKLGNSALAAQAAAKAANISPTGLQNVTTAILSDPSVIEAAAAAIQPKTTSIIPSWRMYRGSCVLLIYALTGQARMDQMEMSKHHLAIPDGRTKICADLRPPVGERDPFHVQLAKQ